MIEAVTKLAELTTEWSAVEEQGEAGLGNVPLRRPLDTVLRNDGIRRYWLAPEHTYRLAHDGTGWRVTSPEWTDHSHTYRLADAQDARLIGKLPTTAGTILLDEGRAYDLREVSTGVWVVHLVN